MPFDLSQYSPALLATLAVAALLVLGVLGSLLQILMELFFTVVFFAARGLFFIGFWVFMAFLVWHLVQKS